MAAKRRSQRKGAKGDPNRSSNGQFVKGHNAPGPGNPQVRKVHEFRRAILSALDPEHVQGVIRKLTKQALAGDVAAARVVLERCAGKAEDVTATQPLELPSMGDAAGCEAAAEVIVRALSRGDLTAEQAERYAALVELKRRTIETRDLAQRVEALERGAGA